MSQITMHKCENCGLTVEDRYAFKGWIEIDLRKVSQQAGRNENGHAQTAFFKSYTCQTENLMDYCSKQCLGLWIDKTLPNIRSIPSPKRGAPRAK